MTRPEAGVFFWSSQIFGPLFSLLPHCWDLQGGGRANPQAVYSPSGSCGFVPTSFHVTWREVRLAEGREEGRKPTAQGLCPALGRKPDDQTCVRSLLCAAVAHGPSRSPGPALIEQSRLSSWEDVPMISFLHRR